MELATALSLVLMMMVPMTMTTMMEELLLTGVMVKEEPGPNCSEGEYSTFHRINHLPVNNYYQN